MSSGGGEELLAGEAGSEKGEAAEQAPPPTLGELFRRCWRGIVVTL